MSRKTRRKCRSSRHKRSRHHRQRTRKHRGRVRRRTRRKRRRRRKRMRGGMMKLGFSPFPPGGPYNPGSNTNGLDGGYYYVKNNNTVEPPKNVSASSVGGGRRRRRRRKRSRKKRGIRRRRRQRGGGLFSPSNPVVEAVPGGTTIRDAYWGLTNGAVNFWNTWNGQPNNMTASPSDQPIGRQNIKGGSGNYTSPDLAGILNDANRTVALDYPNKI